MESGRLLDDDSCTKGASMEGEGEGLLDDNDFAYAYTDYDQVVGLAGHHVADDWLQTRARVEEHLLAAGAKVVEDNPKGSVTLRPVRKTIYKKKPKAVNVDKNLDEAVQKAVNGLVSMFVGMGAYKPAGILTDTLKAEWKQTCKKDRREEGEGRREGDH